APISISSVVTDHPAGSSLVSIDGGTRVTLTGSGFDKAAFTLHWYEAGLGYVPGPANAISSLETTATTVSFYSPMASPGSRYVVAIVRPTTSEVLLAPSEIVAVDDKGPRIISRENLSYTKPCRVIYNEPVTATGFTAKETPRDYSGDLRSDISDGFEMVVSGTTALVRPRIDVSLSHNRLYEVDIVGISDASGNPAEGGGVFRCTFESLDTLVPQDVRLTVRGSGAVLNDGDMLVRGRQYTIAPSAIDNITPAKDISYQVRRSYDGGRTFDALTGTSTGAPFVLAPKDADSAVAVRLEASDKQGNISTKTFELRLRQPEIHAGYVQTNPSPAEEASRGDVYFSVYGPDADLVTRATIEILGQTYLVSSLTEIGSGMREARIRYLNPRLADIAPETSIPVRLTLEHGSASQSFESEYTLYGDVTPPTVAIVSPVDGANVPIGQPVEVTVRSFDHNGIAQVALSQNGEVVPLADSSRIEITPADAKPIVLLARATDKSGLTSTSAPITLYPVSPGEALKEIALLSPQNGQTYREHQDIEIEVVMRHIETADLYVDFNAVKAVAPVATVSRGAGDPERFSYTLRLPRIDESGVAVVRLQDPQSGKTAKRFVNLVNDDTVEQSLELEVQPSVAALSGTQLMVQAMPPSDMVDYSAASQVLIEDPAGSLAPQPVAIGAGPQFHTISSQPDELVVRSTLEDLSGNQKLEERRVPKIPYLSTGDAVVYQPAQLGDETVAVVAMPGLYGLSETVAIAVNHPSLGYEIRTQSAVLETSQTGSIQSLFFTGAGLLAQVEKDGARWLSYWPVQDGALGQSTAIEISGEVLGGSGEVVFIQHGALLGAQVYVDGRFEPVVGAVENDEIRQSIVDSGRLYVLTSFDEIHVYELALQGVPAVVLAASYTVDSADGFAVDGTTLVTHGDGFISSYRIVPDTDPLVVERLDKQAQITAHGKVLAAFVDGELLWSKVEGDDGHGRWQVYENEKLEGLLTLPAEEIVLSGAAMFWRGAFGTPVSGKVYRRATIAQQGAVTLSRKAVQMPLSLLISGLEDSSTLGGESVSFVNAQGEALPWSRQLIGGVVNWRIPRHALSEGNVIARRMDRSGSPDEYSITVDSAVPARSLEVAPSSTSAVAAGAQVPIAAMVDGAARAQRLTVDWMSAGATLAAEIGDEGAFHWVQTPQSGDTALLKVKVDDSEPVDASMSLVENGTVSGLIRVAQPVNGSEYLEAQALAVDFQAPCTIEGVGAFRYGRVSLQDLDGKEISQALVGQSDAQLAMRLPAAHEWGTLRVLIRAYYGESFRYLDADSVSIGVFPRVSIPAPILSGVSPRVLVGSSLNVSIANRADMDADIMTSLRISDQNGVILCLEDERCELTVSTATTLLQLEARAQDGLGNSAVTTAQTIVLDYLSLKSAAVTMPFDRAVPTVGGAWFAAGRSLYELKGNEAPVRRTVLDAPIEAFDSLADRLLVSVAGSELLVVAGQDAYRVLSRQKVSGVAVAMAVASDIALRATANQLVTYQIAGNALTPKATLATSSAVLEVQARGEQFLVVTKNEILVVNSALQVVRRMAGNFLSAASHNGFVLAAQSSGAISVLSDDGTSWSTALEASAARLVSLGNDVLAITTEGQIALIDARDPRWLSVVARWQAPTEGQSAQAIVARGALWLGGTEGLVLNFTRPAAQERLLAQSQSPRGNAVDVSLSLGAMLVAAQDYGVVSLVRGSSGDLTEIALPSPYGANAQEVVATPLGKYALLPLVKKVVSLKDKGPATTLMEGQPYSHLAANESLVVASAGSRLFFYDLRNKATGFAQLAAGQDVAALSLVDGVLYASTNANQLWRLDISKLVVGADLRIFPDALLSTLSPISRMASDGDHLYYAMKQELHRLDLNSYVDEAVELTDLISDLAVASGTVFAAAGSVVHGISSHGQWAAESVTSVLTASGQILSIAVEGDRMLLGKGTNGYELWTVAHNHGAVSPAIGSPSISSVFEPAGAISLALHDPRQVNAVRYLVNDQVVASVHTPPFNATVKVPANLPNGQPFEISAEVESVHGVFARSTAHAGVLQGENLPSNPFTVELHVDGNSLERPIELSAIVHNSSAAVSLVEFYERAPGNSSFTLVGRHYGPVYEMRSNAELEGAYEFFARAVDEYGNIAESTIYEVEVTSDKSPPRTPVFQIFGTLKNGQPMAGHPFVVTVDVTDDESGVEAAFLKRGERILAAIFENGQIRYEQPALASGEAVDYTVFVIDRAGNELTPAATMRYQAASDNPPQFTWVMAPSSIVELTAFTVNVRAQDDGAMGELRFIWNGRTTVAPCRASSVCEVTVSVKDERTDRVSGSLPGNLLVQAVDSTGQVVNEQKQIMVQPNRPPDASKVHFLLAPYAYRGDPTPFMVY
ncbi:MAG: Ig-like domain-containing protein, partial [Myxococcota bacterium]|nr:Ig-like domain-containing protein [Myxococcota bacterium]